VYWIGPSGEMCESMEVVVPNPIDRACTITSILPSQRPNMPRSTCGRRYIPLGDDYEVLTHCRNVDPSRMRRMLECVLRNGITRKGSGI